MVDQTSESLETRHGGRGQSSRFGKARYFNPEADISAPVRIISVDIPFDVSSFPSSSVYLKKSFPNALDFSRGHRNMFSKHSG